MKLVRRITSGTVLAAALVAFVATSPPSAFDQEMGEATLSVDTPSLSREVELELELQGAFGSETVDFSCGLAWEEGAPPTSIQVTVQELNPAKTTEPQTTRVQSSIGTKYDDGSRTPGPHALVSLPIPCEGDASCSARYRFTCELPEASADRAVNVEWTVSSYVRYDPGGLCGGGKSTLELRSREVIR